MVMKLMMKLWTGAAVLAAMMLAGCVSGPTTVTSEPADNGAGQAQSAPAKPGSQTVTVTGNVARHVIPWQDGLTLSQAFAMAGYQGVANPAQLAIQRKGQMGVFVNFQDLNGQDMLLNAGDQIEIRMTPTGVQK
jgi:hypothetical protein